MSTIYSYPALLSGALANPVFDYIASDGLVTTSDFVGANHSQGPRGIDWFRPGFKVSFPEDDPYFTSIEELATGKEGTPFSAGGTRTYTRRFRVMVKTNLIGPAGVCSCPGVPLPFAPYTPNRKEEWDRLAVAVDIKAAQELSDDWQPWIVTVSYSTDTTPYGPTYGKTGLGNALSGTQQNPWDEPATVEADVENETVYPNLDLDGFAYVNSADMAFTPAYSHPTGYRAYTVIRNEKKTTFENRTEDYVYVVNKTTWKGYPPGYVLCTGGRGPLVWRGSIPYYRVTYKLLCKKRVQLEDGSYTAGWQPKILDAGMFQKAVLFGIDLAPGRTVPIVEFGHQVNQPVMLDGTGRRQTEVDGDGNLIPVYLDFKAFRSVELNDLVTF